MTNMDAATLAQVRAADPKSSTWLSANAGSGKTRVLTNRVARLLFQGVEPQNILCLTYTKAAASEMQNRLFRTLGEWAMMADAELSKQLSGLGVEGALNQKDLAKARTLFARAIETPGGLRIQTIHSFCAGILRRFPLEAGVSPQFTEMEDGAARSLRKDVIEAISEERPDLVRGIAAYLTSGDFDTLLTAVDDHRAVFGAVPEDRTLDTLFDLAPGEDLVTLLDRTILPGDREALEELAGICSKGGSRESSAAPKLAMAAKDMTASAIAHLESVFLYGETAQSPYGAKVGKFPNQPTQKANPDLMAVIEPLMERVEAARPVRLALLAKARTKALYSFATEFTQRYEAAKLARGQLDFDDQITKTRALLRDPRVAQWILFRLDGGIDHILVDEAQDTSREQWDVIEALASEFSSGIGARSDRERTIFVVGDKKQSIYSFQGADPQGFDLMADQFEGALRQIEKPFERAELLHSFRSSAAILNVVDCTFEGEAGIGLGAEASRHVAFHTDMPGRVDLWPTIPAIEKAKDDVPWHKPVDATSDEHHDKKLARTIADEIRSMIDRGETIPDPDPKKHGFRRPVSEGDILILLRGRGQNSVVSLHAEIIRACKKLGLNVAGSDRLRVGAELAVRDIEALLRFLALPEDDLSLATALRSPLFGWSEQELFDLAHRRGKKQFLWPALREQAEKHRKSLSILDDLLTEADFLRPYDLINRLLTRHDGRRKLLSRLGHEAEDGIDALLGQALGYERSEVPGLTGFLEWLARDELEVKRQLDTSGNQLRVMTIHGAKGLESPVVILPDTKKQDWRDRAVLYRAGEHVIWKTPSTEAPLVQQAIRADRQQADREEDRRLLYVAMTRAKSWLIVCGAGESGEETDSWHGLVSAGMDNAGAEELETPTGVGKRYSFGDWDGLPISSRPPEPPAGQHRLTPLPPIETPDHRPKTLSPSDLGGEKVLPGETDDMLAETALARGRILHKLLEYLPDTSASDRADLARRLVADDPDAAGLDPNELLEDTERVLNAEGLAPLFTPGTMAEVDLTAWIPALNARVHGAVDRLVIGADTVTAIDYKSNRLVPQNAEDVPEGLLRQMGAYQALLREIWPEKDARVALLWTRTASLMPLPTEIVQAALARVTAP